MEVINFLEGDFSKSIAWALVHSLWQGALLLFALYGLLYMNRHWKASTRYLAVVSTVFLMLLCFILTALYYYNSFQIQDGNLDTQVMFIFNSAIESASFADWIDRNAYIIQLSWFLGITVFVIRFFLGISYLQYLKWGRISVSHEATSNFISMISARMMMKKRVELFEHKSVLSPFTTGFIRPAIFLPLGFINSLSSHEVEAILAHELAHIKRNDFALNIFISMAEIVFYYHPVMWWFTALIRAEREEACDDLAVDVTGDRILYAKALLKLKVLEGNSTPSLAMGFSDSNKHLLNRIKHVLNMPYTRNNFREKLIILSSLVFLALIFMKSNLNAMEKYFREELSEITITPEIKDIAVDTMPKVMKKETYTIIRSNGKEDVELKMDDGKITQLKINGEEINPDEYEKHQELINQVKPKSSGNKMFYLGDRDGEEMRAFELTLDPDNFSRHGVYAFPEMKGYMLKLDSLHDLKFDFKFDSLSDMSFRFDSLHELQNLMELNMLDMQKMQEQLQNGALKNFNFNGLDGMNFRGLDGLNFRGWDKHNFDDRQGFNFEDLEDFEHDGGRNEFERKSEHELGFMHGNQNLEEIIGKQLNKDGFLIPGKENKVELSGKNLKINGDKQPDNIFSKYKRLFEQETGISLSKNSKLEFSVEGRESKRKYKAF